MEKTLYFHEILKMFILFILNVPMSWIVLLDRDFESETS